MKRPRINTIFLGEFRAHVGRSITCGCSLAEPDADCNVGTALYRVATRTQQPLMQDCMLREMCAPPHPRAHR